MAENKTFIQQAFEFAKFIIDRSGMRSLIALLVDVGLLYLIYLLIKGCNFEASITLIYMLLASMVVITVSFFIIRHFEKSKKGEHADI